MAEAYNFLNGSQTDINRRLLRKIEALEKESTESYDDSALQSKIKSLEDRIEALEDAQ